MYTEENALEYPQDYNVPEYTTAAIRQPYSRFAESIILLLWIGMLLEGLFHNYLEMVVQAHEAFWTKVTPYLLYPSELLFYGPVLLLSITLALRGRKFGFKTSRGFALLFPIWILGFWAALHGKYNGAPGFTWLAGLRQIVLMSIFVPFFNMLGSEIRLETVFSRFCKIAIIAAIYNGIVGLMLYPGIISRTGLMSPRFSGEYILLLVYAVLLTKAIVTGKSPKLQLAILAFGILTPLHKPTTTTFVLIHFIAFFLAFIIYGRTKAIVLFRSIKTIIIVGLILLSFVPFIFTLGDGAAKYWLQKRWLKIEAGPASREREITTGRLTIWKWGIDRWKQNPVFGTGFGFEMTIFTEAREFVSIPTHNLPITILYQTGLVGFVVYWGCALAWFKRMYRYFKWECQYETEIWLSLGLFLWLHIMLVSCLFGRSLGITHVGFIFWGIIGLLNNIESQWHYSSLMTIQNNNVAQSQETAFDILNY